MRIELVEAMAGFKSIKVQKNRRTTIYSVISALLTLLCVDETWTMRAKKDKIKFRITVSSRDGNRPFLFPFPGEELRLKPEIMVDGTRD
jgi:hypothetical protein